MKEAPTRTHRAAPVAGDMEELALLAGATGSTSLPLSDRDVAWDAGAARKSLSEAQYPKAHFWRDPEGDPKTLAAYKLPFASAAGGSLTAIWRGVTACAGAVQGARGGVQIPDADMASVKSKIASYYAKARKVFKDPNLKPPWEASSSKQALLLLAYADCAGALALDPFYGDDGDLIGVGGAGPEMDEFLALRAYWQAEFQAGECANCGHVVSMHPDGGACTAQGCDCEKSAEAQAAETPGQVALDALDALQYHTDCECGHALSEHIGGDGPCKHEDGRGTCSCGGFSEAALDDAHAGVRDDLGLDDRGAISLAALADALGFGDDSAFVNRRRRELRALLAAALPEPTLELTLETTQAWDGHPAFARASLGLTERSSSSWPSEAVPAPVGEVLFRDDTGFVAVLDSGAVVAVHGGHGWIDVSVAAAEYAGAQDSIATFMAEYPPLFREAPSDEAVVPITFWTYGQFGPSRRMRLIGAKPWAEIQGNYPAAIRDDLAALANEFEPGKGGQLMLWQGTPGTGKTWMLRALASEWAPWAEFHYITDPDAFFVTNPDYMIDVLLADTYDAIEPESGDLVEGEHPEGKWRVLILEDTGELLAENAKQTQGQGISRLLNVVDGMVGQGLRILVLLTTNEELGDLHPAAQRPGRCASRLSFPAFTAEEATEWLDGLAEAVGSLTIAELYEARAAGEAAFELEEEEEEPVTAAAGAVAFGPEDGFRELIDDLDELLCPDEPMAVQEYRAVDVALTLDRALIRECSGDDFWVAPITIDAAGEPTLSPRSEWLPVERGWIEVPPEPDEGVAVAATSFTITSTHCSTCGTWHGSSTNFAPVEVALPPEHQPGETLPARPPAAAPAPGTAPTTRATEKRWTADFVPEGTLTEDGRAMRPGSIRWRDLPLSLMAMIETADGHDGATLAGRIDRIWREGDLIRAGGIFDDNEFSQEIARLVAEGKLRGLSVDLAILDAEQGPISDYFDENGDWIAGEPSQETAEPSLADLFAENPIFVINDAVIGMACHSADTEVLTESGWKRFPKVKRGEKVATRNQLTKAIEYHEPTYFHAEPWRGPMFRFHNSRNLDLLVTPNHRMLVQSRNGDEWLMPAHELVSRARGTLGIPLVAGWHDQEADTFTIEQDQIAEGVCACGCGAPMRVRERWEGGGRGPGTITKTLPGHGHGLNREPLDLGATDFAAFMGAWLAEGSILKSWPGRIFVSQMEKSRGYEAYRVLLERMFGKVNHDGRVFSIKNVRLWRYLRQFGGASEKFVPDEIKQYGRGQLQTFFDHYMLGDGSKSGGTAYTTSSRLADDLQEIAQKLGMWARIRTREHTTDSVLSDGRTIKAENKKLQYQVAFRNRSLSTRSNRASWLWDAEEVDYSGTVYCLSVPNEVFYVRRNGIPAWSGNTVCPFPAFAGASISVTAAAPLIWRLTFQGGFSVTETPVEAEAVVASAVAPAVAERPVRAVLTASGAGLAPERPPAAWFDDPLLEEVTPLTVTDDGRVYGHLAPWGVCHIGLPGCRTAPRSETEYAYMHLAEVLCDDDTRVPIGKVTLGTGHADRDLGFRAAIDHYDNTGTVAAYVRSGEDDHGIWVAGALNPDLPEAKVRELRAAVLSGDWRNIDGNLELVAALAVNVPGFPVLRSPRALIAAGADGPVVLSLAASGIHFAVPSQGELEELGRLAATPDEQRALAELATLAAEAV